MFYRKNYMNTPKVTRALFVRSDAINAIFAIVLSSINGPFIYFHIKKSEVNFKHFTRIDLLGMFFRDIQSEMIEHDFAFAFRYIWLSSPINWFDRIGRRINIKWYLWCAESLVMCN